MFNNSSKRDIYYYYKRIKIALSLFDIKITPEVVLNFIKDLFTFSSTKIPPIDQNKIQIASQWIQKSNRVVFFTGAGMSAGSGISTYRGKFGLWVMGRDISIVIIVFWMSVMFVFVISCFYTKLLSWKMFIFVNIMLLVLLILGNILPFVGAFALSTPVGWNLFPKLSWIIFKIFFFDKIVKAKLNDGHRFMEFLPTQNISTMVITANVDGLEKKACHHVTQLHGSADKFCCLNCQRSIRTFPLTEKLPWFPPKCHQCHKRQFRTGCLLFMEDGTNSLKIDSIYNIHFDDVDVAVVIGSSGIIPCGYSLIPSHIRTIEINLTPEPQTPVKKYKEKYIYIQGYQEEILKEIKSNFKY